MNAELDARAHRAVAALHGSAEDLDPVGRLHDLHRAERRRGRAQVVVAFALLVALAAAGVLVGRYDPPAAGPLPSLVTIGVGQQPAGLAVGEGALWVVNHGAGTVSRIDPASGRVVATVPVADRADGVAVGRGAVWVGGWSRAEGDIVRRVDPRTNQVVATVPVASEPYGLAVTDDAVWATSLVAGTVTRLDPRTNRVVASLRVAQPQGVAIGFGSVWVPSQRAGEVLRIDLRTEPRTVSATGRIEVAGEPAFVTAGTDAIWVGTTEGNLHRIDPRTGTVAATYPLGRPLHGMAVDGRSLWTVDPVGDTVSRARLPGQGQRP